MKKNQVIQAFTVLFVDSHRFIRLLIGSITIDFTRAVIRGVF